MALVIHQAQDICRVWTTLDSLVFDYFVVFIISLSDTYTGIGVGRLFCVARHHFSDPDRSCVGV